MTRLDIVTELRAWGSNGYMMQAADEIERLRAIVQGWEHSARNAERDMATLRAERDEARREICKRVSTTRWHPQFPLMGERQYAEERGWDCFKENTDD